MDWTAQQAYRENTSGVKISASTRDYNDRVIIRAWGIKNGLKGQSWASYRYWTAQPDFEKILAPKNRVKRDTFIRTRFASHADEASYFDGLWR